MKKLKSHFKFTKEERSGIFFLLLIIVLLQIVYFLIKMDVFEYTENNFAPNAQEQSQIDTLRRQTLQKDSIKLYHFNPNFITDYKGYTLGMSVDEISKLHTFRKTDAYVNSAKDFQKITGVSDSLLQSISPYFKFPEWTQKVKQSSVVNKKKQSFKKSTSFAVTYVLKDINTANAESLKSINGIGDKLSTRIIKFRDRLGGFLSMDQLYDVYSLEPAVVSKVKKRYGTLSMPNIELIKINEATAYEISKLIYIKYDVAKNIVAHRKNNGAFTSFTELKSIEGFPSEKIDRISLYLSLD